MAIYRTLLVCCFFFEAIALLKKTSAASFTLSNNCDHTVWPGIQSGAGTPALSTTGFELPAGQTMTLEVPAGWSGRLWGRTLCKFDESGKGNCATGDCGGTLQCNGNNAVPPATLAEFTLGKTTADQDFYDVSLVDGFNLQMVVSTVGGHGSCAATGCLSDINRSCPKELQVDGNVACKSACEAFGTPEYCCSGEFSNPDTCKPSLYSQLFKSACPRSYSYAYDDASSTFTCISASYVVTFCQALNRQQRSITTGSNTSNNSGNTSPPSTKENATGDVDGYVAWDVSTTAAPSMSAAVSGVRFSMLAHFSELLLALVFLRF